MRLVNKGRFITCIAVGIIATLCIVVPVKQVEAVPVQTSTHVSYRLIAEDTIPVSVVEPAPIPTLYTPTVIEKEDRGDIHREEDVMLLAKLIYGEAGCESYAGKLAVGTVVMNRMEDSNQKLFGGPTLEGVIFREGQFDCVKSNWHEPDDDSIKAAKEVLDGYRSFRESIVYYYNPKIATDKAFINSIKKVITIGHHTFAEERG